MINLEYGDGTYDMTWFIVDLDNNIAQLTTNGFGFIPKNDESGEVLFDWVEKLNSDKKVNKATPVPNGYWYELAQKGLFAFDYEDDNYTLVALPAEPIKYQNNCPNIVRVNFRFEDRTTINSSDF
jgi:hypothetical protein